MRLSHGPDCLSDQRDSPVAGHGGRCPCGAGRAGHSCRDAEADPHGLVDHGDSPAALRRGGYVPGVKVCELVGPCAQAQGQG